MKSILPKSVYQSILTITIITLTFFCCTTQSTDKLKEAFKNPPDTSKPGVYWYFMDGNLSREAMTKDLESMKEVGISNLIFLEVGIGETAYLRRLDVFISCSQWEGFNLPLVEAQALGTVGLAFDVGAHPEVTPLVVAHLHEAVTLIDTYSRHPGLLGEHAAKGYHFVRRRFAWNDTTTRFLSGIQI